MSLIATSPPNGVSRRAVPSRVGFDGGSGGFAACRAL